MNLLIRILARLMAMGALTGCGILLLICCISTPVIKQFTFSTTTFDSGGSIDLGLWGYCTTSAAGVQSCSPTSVGYNFSPAGLQNYSANPGSSNLNVVNKALSSALIFFPLATGATFLALLLSLVPIRIVTIMALGATFLSIGATLIAFVLAIICFGQANARLGLLFNPNTNVHPVIGRCVWFAIAAATAECGAFIFLLACLTPKKEKAGPPRAYAEPPSRYEKENGVDYGLRKPVPSVRSRTRGTSTYEEYGNSDLERRGSRRSQRSDIRRSHSGTRRYSNDDEYERERPVERRHSNRDREFGSGRRHTGAVSRADDETDDGPAYY